MSNEPKIKVVYDKETNKNLKRLEKIEDMYLQKHKSRTHNGFLGNNFDRDDMGMIKIEGVRDKLLEQAIPTHIIIIEGDKETIFKIG